MPAISADDLADESYAPPAERARNVVVGPDSSRLLNFVFVDYSGETDRGLDRVLHKATSRK